MKDAHAPFLCDRSADPRVEDLVLVPGDDPGAPSTLQALIENRRPAVVDAIDAQIEELFWIRNPSRDSSDAADREACRAFVSNFPPAGADRWRLGSWAYWPWRNTLAHVLPETEYQEVRTSRNRNLITAGEQQAFRDAHVAVAGLSVGNSIALTLAIMGGRAAPAASTSPTSTSSPPPTNTNRTSSSNSSSASSAACSSPNTKGRFSIKPCVTACSSS